MSIVRRSIVIDDRTTSLGLEADFWAELDAQAEQRGLSWPGYVRQLVARLPGGVNRAAAIKQSILRSAKGDSPEAGLCTVWKVIHDRSSTQVHCRGARLLVGRDATCDIRIRDPDISRRHAMLAHDGESWWVIDLSSRNGTAVGGNMISAARVKRRTAVTMGTSELIQVS